MNDFFAKVGVLVSISSVPAFLVCDWLLWSNWAHLYFSGRISYLAWHEIMNVPVITIAAVGLVFYIVGRGSVWKQENGWSRIILVAGVMLFFLGVYANLLNKGIFSDMVSERIFHSEPVNPGEPWASSLAMVWSSLWIITGVVWLVDRRLHTSSRAVLGVAMMVTSLVALWDLGSFRVLVQDGTSSGYFVYFLGYTVHSVIFVILVAVMLSGMALSIYQLRTKLV